MDMRAAAEWYCFLVERAESTQRAEFVAEVAQSLAELVAAAGRLPHVEPSDAELPEGLSHEQWYERFAGLQSALDDWDDYWTAMCPFGGWEMEAVNLPLADDLADVWRDVKYGLVALDAGAAETDVIWEWRFSFYAHWGRHATEALRVCHARRADNIDRPRA
ncbi:MAG TPA: DUF5063 domain-containing protein, partial [Solirubrobacteraceae bacterium]|nr:DUF5063 domain-containing protein [Solirubrobacteraceae bacterium]